MYCPLPTGASTRPLSVVPRPGEEGREGLPEPEGRVTVFEVGRVTVFELVGRVTVLEVVGRVTVFEVGRVFVEVEDELLSPTDASWVQCVKSRPLVLAIMLSC